MSTTRFAASVAGIAHDVRARRLSACVRARAAPSRQVWSGVRSFRRCQAAPDRHILVLWIVVDVGIRRRLESARAMSGDRAALFSGADRPIALFQASVA